MPKELISAVRGVGFGLLVGSALVVGGIVASAGTMLDCERDGAGEIGCREQTLALDRFTYSEWYLHPIRSATLERRRERVGGPKKNLVVLHWGESWETSCPFAEDFEAIDAFFENPEESSLALKRTQGPIPRFGGWVAALLGVGFGIWTVVRFVKTLVGLGTSDPPSDGGLRPV